MTRKSFFRKLYFEIILAVFFIFLATTHYPGNGFDFITLFCCLFATTSIVTSINMLPHLQRVEKNSPTLIENLPDDEDSLDDKEPKKSTNHSANRIGFSAYFRSILLGLMEIFHQPYFSVYKRPTSIILKSPNLIQRMMTI